MTGFDDVWRLVLRAQGERFHQKRGQAFTYTIVNGAVVPSTTNRKLPRSHFAEAHSRLPIDGPGELQDLQGPSYLFAILTDERIHVSGAGAARNI